MKFNLKINWRNLLLALIICISLIFFSLFLLSNYYKPCIYDYSSYAIYILAYSLSIVFSLLFYLKAENLFSLLEPKNYHSISLSITILLFSFLLMQISVPNPIFQSNLSYNGIRFDPCIVYYSGPNVFSQLSFFLWFLVPAVIAAISFFLFSRSHFSLFVFFNIFVLALILLLFLFFLFLFGGLSYSFWDILSDFQ